MRQGIFLRKIAIGLVVGLSLAGCANNYPEAPTISGTAAVQTDYLIGPGDSLNIFVWRHADLSTTVPVRPDGRISVPLIEDVQAAGKTPAALGDEIEKILARFVQEPNVTIIVTSFVGPFAEQIRIVGQATAPRAISYRQGMTVLDAIIEVGGLTEYAAGNRAVLMRETDEGEEKVYRIRLNDLLRDGKVKANVDLLPGDIIIIPESRF